jgi:hypothetical protein
MTTYYKVLDPDGQPRNGGSGQYSLPTKNDDGSYTPGEWMPAVEGELELCENGYHLCRPPDLIEWLGPEIYAAEYRGERIDGSDKIVVRECRLTRKVEAWNDRTARLFAVWCAREALKLIDNPDPRSVAACDVAERYANGEATDDELAAAWAAAWAAARDAAWAAAWAAARAAARDAARAAQSSKLLEMLGEVTA